MASSDVTIAAQLATDRSARRQRRMELVVRELRRRAEDRRHSNGSVPAPLGLAIESFEEQLQQLRDTHGDVR